MLDVQDAGYRVGSNWLVRHVGFRLRAGELVVIVGPNGSGKTTLLRLLSGEHRASQGSVRLFGREMSHYGIDELARCRSILRQTRESMPPFTSREVVLLGRTPHLIGARASDADVRAVRDAMLRLDVSHLAERSFPTLSGGEAHRVEMARVLAQEASLVLVDEPTNHLDLRHQIDLLETLVSIAREGRLVVAVLHDLNLASRFADRILMLSAGALVAEGSPGEVLTSDLLEEVFGVPFDVARQASRPLLVPKLQPVREGSGPLKMSYPPGGRT